jgi:hypothetical protein
MTDRALSWLDIARANHDAGLAAIKGDPLLKNLAGDVRFISFLKQLGLS